MFVGFRALTWLRHLKAEQSWHDASCHGKRSSTVPKQMLRLYKLICTITTNCAWKKSVYFIHPSCFTLALNLISGISPTQMDAVILKLNTKRQPVRRGGERLLPMIVVAHSRLGSLDPWPTNNGLFSPSRIVWLENDLPQASSTHLFFWSRGRDVSVCVLKTRRPSSSAGRQAAGWPPAWSSGCLITASSREGMCVCRLCVHLWPRRRQNKHRKYGMSCQVWIIQEILHTKHRL